MQCARDVVRCFNDQTYAHKRLCLVVNGCGAPADVEEQFQQWGVAPDLLLHSPTHPKLGKPWALNKAMDVLRGELIALRDDDDVQGPEDLSEAVAAYQSTGATIVSKHPHRVLVDDQLWLFAESLANQWAKRGDEFDARVSGSNVLFLNQDVPKFPEVPSGEVRHWAKAMIDQGASVWRTSVDNYTWVRGRHAHRWQATLASIRDEYGRRMPAKRYLADGSFEMVNPPTTEEILADFGNWK